MQAGLHRLTLMIACAIVVALACAPAADAQSHFSDCGLAAGPNATIILTAENPPAIGERPAQAGDEIAVFTSAGRCVGSLRWEGRSAALSVWGNDELSRITDALEPGGPMHFHIWSASENMEYHEGNSIVTARFSSEKPHLEGSGTYVEDGIYVVDQLRFTERPARASAEKSSDVE